MLKTEHLDVSRRCGTRAHLSRVSGRTCAICLAGAAWLLATCDMPAVAAVELASDAVSPRDPSQDGESTDSLLERAAAAARANDTRDAYRLYARAAEQASAAGEARAASIAWGSVGALYERAAQLDDALAATRKAVMAAQQVAASDLLYRWEWQTARLLDARDDAAASLGAYERAVYALQNTHGGAADECEGEQTRTFRSIAEPLYAAYVERLLDQADTIESVEDQQPFLESARSTMELLKVAELQDYFRDECIEAAREHQTSLDDLGHEAAVVYPISLEDRLEILVTTSTGLRRATVRVTRKELETEVAALRRLLEKRTTHEYRAHARRVYDWLIAPIEAYISETKTLIVVPDGPLLTIPIGALHDGRQFLVERFAIGVTPGLSLTDPRPLDAGTMKVLVGGVTEQIEDFAPLPNVSKEVAMLRELFDADVLLDDDFTQSRLDTELEARDYTVLHVASHGQFGSTLDDTFLLTHDDRITMSELSGLLAGYAFRERPMELLTLSACETASGNENAALGLAGVAIRAGAKSALGSLWFVNDEVTATTVGVFYGQLAKAGSTKAKALQTAQLAALHDPRYAHPGYWAPFLLVNNWL